ncbi:MAG: hypothetical protein GF334_07345 [Candidatus Altiarchaeales archaeon]|nr:hypothetical protein [Candidatus Altiarchaeales archaeon]
MTDDIVMIGDYLGTIEEFLPGEGTFAEDGKIYAAVCGQRTLNPKNHTAEVEGKRLPKLTEGQVVFGEVMTIRKSQVTLLVSKIKGIDTLIDEKTSIYVSNIDDKYVEKPDDMFGVGDLVKAKVIKINGNLVDVSTKGDMGVVKAFCKRCRNDLIPSKKKKGKMECVVCGHLELRKTAPDYGDIAEL